MIHLVMAQDFPLWAAWLLNHFVHAALWLGAALLVLRIGPQLGAHGRNLIWRAVLLGPLLSATVHTAAVSPWRLASWRLQVAEPAPAVVALDDPEPLPRVQLTAHAAVPLVDPASPALYPLAPVTAVAPTPVAAAPAVRAIAATHAKAAVATVLRGQTGRSDGSGHASALDGASAAAAGSAAPFASSTRGNDASAGGATRAPTGDVSTGLLALAGLAWFAFVIVALVRLVRVVGAGVRWRRDIGVRRPAHDPEVLGMLARLGARSQVVGAVRLTEAKHLECPVAIGTREICLPARIDTRLDDRMLRAVLAHELAHLERRDNLWLTVAATIEAVLFLQPLVRVVRRKMEDSAELACDDRAVELTGDPIALARSLAEVASWSLVTPGPRALAHAMAAPGRALSARVERLLKDRHPHPRLGRVITAVAIGCLAVVGLGAPAVVRPVSARTELAGADADDQRAARTAVPRVARTVATTPLRAVRALGPRRALAAAATVANDKPGAPRLPARPSITVTADETVTAPRRRDVLRGRGRRGNLLVFPPGAHQAISEMVNQALALPGAAAFAGEIGTLASEEARTEVARDAARESLERARRQNAPAAEVRAAEQKLGEAERRHAAARKTLTEREQRFERDMEAWGKEMERRGEALGRHMHAWGGDLHREFRDDGGERARLHRAAGEMKRKHERLKREAERMKREAERLERRARAFEERFERGQRGRNERGKDSREDEAERIRERAERLAEEHAERAERLAEEHAEKAERQADERAQKAEREAEKAEREAEREAERAEREAERARRDERTPPPALVAPSLPSLPPVLRVAPVPSIRSTPPSPPSTPAARAAPAARPTPTPPVTTPPAANRPPGAPTSPPSWQPPPPAPSSPSPPKAPAPAAGPRPQ